MLPRIPSFGPFVLPVVAVHGPGRIRCPIGSPRARVCFALWIFAVGVILAALPSPAAGAAAPVSGPLVRFTVFGLRPAGEVAFVPKPGASPQAIRFYPTARSPRYEYRGSSPLRFIDPETNAVVAEAVVPPGAGEVLILLSPSAIDGKAAGARRFEVTMLEDTPARHPSGSLVIVNLSGLVLAGTVNERPVSPGPGPGAPLAVGRAAEVRLTTSAGTRRLQSYAGTIALARDERALLVLFPPFRAGSAEVQARLLVDKTGPGSKTPSRK